MPYEGSGHTTTDGALSKFRILDLTRVWAGPLGTRALGDLGADVIKISDPRIPLDSSARVKHNLNRNQRNIGLDYILKMMKN